MGTRADFYVGEGPDAEWLGSIAFDGDPSGEPRPLLDAHDEITYRHLVDLILDKNAEDATRPEQGWPWPWDTSAGTDHAYAWMADGGHVLASHFGSAWYDPLRWTEQSPPDFPDMSARRNLAEPGSPRSGLIVIAIPDELP